MATIALGNVISKAVPFWGAVISMAANAIDNRLFGPKTTAARLDSTSLQDSAYGGMIPKPFGLIRTSCNIIYAGAFVSHSHTSRSGKGGGTSTSYTYTISLDVALCMGPILAVRRAWVDGAEYIISSISKVSGNEKAAEFLELTKTSSLAAAISATNGCTYTFKKVSDTSQTFSCRVYLGTEDQLPDSYIEAANGGAGTTPGYRGLAHVVLQDFDLTNYGRIPQFQFEVITNMQQLPADYSSRTINNYTFDSKDLSYAFLTNSTFNNCSFKNCRLDNADFTSTHLNNCSFNGAFMRGCILTLATVNSCNFDHADVRDANFVSANVYSSSFSGTDLRGAAFDGGS